MPPHNPHPLPSLTLIVATTPIRTASSTTKDEITRLGIGLNGTLPWPRIKTDMSFFARVTSRPPSPGKTNAIIMGRKTYDSVPASLRPLAKRINVVITRDTSGSVRDSVNAELERMKKKIAAKAAEAHAQTTSAEKETFNPPQETVPADPMTDAIVTPSLGAALEQLDSVYGAQGTLGKIFVIGGAEIYNATLKMGAEELAGRPVRVVMTNVVRKGAVGAPASFECDTFFPLDGLHEENGWRAVSSEEVSEWVGEEVDGEWKGDGDVEVQMVGFEKLT
ncbi:Dihydrofolate reductase [Penicillium cf. griseofulvum]|uniref:Dihydrofolate reductase n=1 Tax=Penicillium cf. griseofulvum TaxID=2972120 RepID=A0A9W9MU17_9EURO|nr:Dihydrofolate reductase [Penicillium cf. griseofulvum]KAJ5445925.1 Dihydrofolate reductase [Penicillium cf. griseofulvum]KAJ5447648.1 Dihydrofolate reductase [Penicillium cf. griseofulvum]